LPGSSPRPNTAILVTGVLAAPVAVGPTLTEFFTNQSTPRWMTFTSGVALVVLGLLSVGVVGLVRIENRRREDSQDVAVQEVRVSHLVGEYGGHGEFKMPRMQSTWLGRYTDMTKDRSDDPKLDAAREVLEELKAATTRLEEAAEGARQRMKIELPNDEPQET